MIAPKVGSDCEGHPEAYRHDFRSVCLRMRFQVQHRLGVCGLHSNNFQVVDLRADSPTLTPTEIENDLPASPVKPSTSFLDLVSIEEWLQKREAFAMKCLMHVPASS